MWLQITSATPGTNTLSGPSANTWIQILALPDCSFFRTSHFFKNTNHHNYIRKALYYQKHGALSIPDSLIQRFLVPWTRRWWPGCFAEDLGEKGTGTFIPLFLIKQFPCANMQALACTVTCACTVTGVCMLITS